MANSQRLTVLLVDMAMETYGGVADAIATLASKLLRYDVAPVVLLHNPVSNSHPYVRYMRQHDVRVWAVSEGQKGAAVALFRLIAYALLPLALIDALLRRKSLAASRQSVWSLLRRVGYWGLRIRFLWLVVVARIFFDAGVVHFFKPDAWPVLQWIRFLRFQTLYTEETDPLLETPYYYAGLHKHRACLDGITAVSAVSAYGIQSVLGLSVAVPVIPNMVDLDIDLSALPLSSGRTGAAACTIALIGRLSPQKSIDTFLVACRQVLMRFPDVRCLIHGDGPERKRLEELCTHLNIADRVRFAGAFSKVELSEVMATLDIFVLSSIYEGLPVSILEAMAYAKPVVSTQVGGVVEVVDDGVTGLLVPAQDPARLAEAICRLIGDPCLRHRMGEAGRKRYEAHFTPAVVLPQYVAMYHALASGTPLS
jgi:glycosyltransferase involved in cell wall biosynthesis